MSKDTLKDLRKAAFAVGFGFTVGKYVGKLFNSVIDGAVRGIISISARRGNEFAQEMCNRTNIEYKVNTTCDEEPKMKIGF